MVQSGIVKPRGITIDIATYDVYWTDTAVDAIQVLFILLLKIKYLHLFVINKKKINALQEPQMAF